MLIPPHPCNIHSLLADTRGIKARRFPIDTHHLYASLFSLLLMRLGCIRSNGAVCPAPARRPFGTKLSGLAALLSCPNVGAWNFVTPSIWINVHCRVALRLCQKEHHTFVTWTDEVCEQATNSIGINLCLGLTASFSLSMQYKRYIGRTTRGFFFCGSRTGGTHVDLWTLELVFRWKSRLDWWTLSLPISLSAICYILLSVTVIRGELLINMMSCTQEGLYVLYLDQ